MSSLGISLLILVVVGVGGVAVYNFWLMRGQARSLTNLLVDRLDAPDATRRHEPTLPDEPATRMPGPVPAVSPAPGKAPAPRSEPGFLDSLEEEIRTRASASAQGASDPTGVSDRNLDERHAPSQARERTTPSPTIAAGPVVRPWFGDHVPEPDWAVVPQPAPSPSESKRREGATVLPAEPGPPDRLEPVLRGGETVAPTPEPRQAQAAGDAPVASSPESEGATPAVTAPADPPVSDDLPASGAFRLEPLVANDDSVSPQVTRASDDPDRPGGSEPAPEDSPAAVATTPGPSAVSAGVAAEGGANPPEDPARLVGQPQVEDSGPGTGETAVDEPVPADDFHLTLLVETGSPQPGARLARLTRDMHRVGAKPVEVLGRHVYADGSRRFEVLRESMGYDALCLRLLLVNRQGPVNAMEYSEFASHAQRLNEDLEVLVDLPDMSDVLARARELDETIGPLDAQMAVNVEVPATLSPDEFSRIALRLGLHEQTSQRFARIDRHGEPLFTAALTEKAGRILLLLDVPRARSEGQPIREVVETAWKFAQAFEGRMVDDAGNPIDNALFERIENQLETLYHALDAHGLPAGSPLARRVFNL